MSKECIYGFSQLADWMEKLKSRLNIAVIHGGCKEADGAVIYKTHNPRSWKSYEKVAGDIANALRNVGFQNVTMLPDDIRLLESLRRERIHFAWLNTGGVQGYESMAHAAGMLEMAGIPYVGHSPLNTCRLDNKHVFKREVASLGIETPEFMTWYYLNGPLPVKYDRQFERVFGDYDGPFVVKPVTGRASLHVHLVASRDDLPEVVHTVSEVSQNYVLIEKFMSGREFCVAVAGYVVHSDCVFTRREAPFAFSEVERVLDDDEAIFTSMDKKAITTDRARLVRGEDDPDLKRRLAALGQKVYRLFDLKSVIRLDIRADENGVLNVLEVNPKPDLKRPAEGVISLATIGLFEHNMDYEDMILSLFADRLDYLLTNRARSVGHIMELIN